MPTQFVSHGPYSPSNLRPPPPPARQLSNDHYPYQAGLVGRPLALPEYTPPPSTSVSDRERQPSRHSSRQSTYNYVSATSASSPPPEASARSPSSSVATNAAYPSDPYVVSDPYVTQARDRLFAIRKAVRSAELDDFLAQRREEMRDEFKPNAS